MDYCGPTGIPHSTFLQWKDLDQDKALAWQDLQKSRCHNCGTYPDEWLTPDGQLRDPPPYTVDTMRCRGCVSLEEERKAAEQGHANMTGLFFFLRRWLKGELRGNRSSPDR